MKVGITQGREDRSCVETNQIPFYVYVIFDFVLSKNINRYR